MIDLVVYQFKIGDKSVKVTPYLSETLAQGLLHGYWNVVNITEGITH